MAESVLIRFQILNTEGKVLGGSGDEPLRLEPGDSRLPPKLVSAIFSMKAGQAEKVPLKAADAFGEIDPKKRFALDPSGFKDKPQLGMAVQLQSQSGEMIQARVVEVTAEGVKVDANHPLAGRDLVFAVTILEADGASADSARPSPGSAPPRPPAPQSPPPTPETPSATSMLIRFQILTTEGKVLGGSGDEPLRLEPGDSRLPPKLVSAIFSMQPGQAEKVPLKAADAFGELDPKKRFALDPSRFKDKPQLGMAVQLQSESGEMIQARVVEVTAEGIKVDANHPLAGRDLVFAVTILEADGASADSARPSPGSAPPRSPAPQSPPPTPATPSATSMLIRFQILTTEGKVLGGSGDEPLRLEPGDSRLPPKLVSAIFSMQPGQAEKVPLKAADAFGELDPKKRFALDPSGFQEKPRPGMAVQVQSESGEKIQARVVEVTAEGVKVDANHPLAGRDLVFAVTILEAEGAPAASTPSSPSNQAAPSPPPPPPRPPSSRYDLDIPELPPPPPPPPPEPGMETVGFLDTSGYNIAGL